MFKNRSPEQKRKMYRDIGMYTIIPTMMVVGPILGYLLGRLIEKKWGLAPWPSTGGAIFGLLAVVRQIWIILTRNGGER